MSYPLARLSIQDFKSDFKPSDGVSPAIVLTAKGEDESGGLFTATVDVSTISGQKGDEFAASANVTINNPSKDVVNAANRGAFLQLEAGWPGSSFTRPRVIYHGVISDTRRSISSGTRTLVINCRTFANHMFQSVVTHAVEDGDTIGEALGAILAPAGITLNADDDFANHKLSAMMLRGQLNESINQLMTIYTDETGRRALFHTKPHNPFTLTVRSFTEDGRIAGGDELLAIPVDLGSSLVYSASEAYDSEDDPAPPSPVLGVQKEEDGSVSEVLFRRGEDGIPLVGFTITRRLDPRIDIGRVVKYEGSEDDFLGSGMFVVDEVTHTIGGEWTTVCRGKMLAPGGSE